MFRITTRHGLWSSLLGLLFLFGAPQRAQAGLLEAKESIFFGSGYPSVNVDLKADSVIIRRACPTEAAPETIPLKHSHTESQVDVPRRTPLGSL
jgi:hypothetical protein